MGKRGQKADTQPPLPRAVGAARKRKKSGNGGGDGDDVHSQPQLSLAAFSSAFECGTCGCTDTEQKMRDTTVPSCTACFDRYSKGFTQFGSLEVVQLGVQDEDSHIHDCWEEAKRTEAGERGQFFPTSVDEGTEFIVSVVKPMVGLSRAQLVADVLHDDPEKLGIKLQDLPDHEGNCYKGILIPSPNRPYLEYDVATQVVAKMAAHKMVPSQQMFEAQSAGTFAYAIAQESKMKTVCVKARTENHTLESLRLKGDAYRKAQEELKVARQLAEEHDSSQFGSPSGAQAAAGSQLGGAVAVSVGPMLNPTAMACSRTVFTGEGGRGVPRTPGAKPRTAKSAVSEAKQSEVEELVDRRIAALDVNRCWSGVAMGRELRWAKESHATIMESNPTVQDSETADKLREHISVCDAICGLVEKPIATVPKQKLEDLLCAIEKGDEDMPSKWKMDVLKLKVTETITLPDMDMNDFFYIIAPWEVSHPDGNVDYKFKPTRPRVITCDGSVSDKMSSCEGFFSEALAYHIQAGRGGQSKLVAFCSTCLDWLDDKCPDDETFDELVSSMTTCLKALLCIADPMCLEYSDALTTMTDARSSELGKVCLRHLNLAVKRSTHYTALKEEFDQFYPKTNELFPVMMKTMSTLDAGSDINAVAQSGSLKAALEMLPNVVTYCRPGSFDNFKLKMAAKIGEYVDCYVFGDGVDGAADPALTAWLAEMKALLIMAKTSLPEKLSLWLKALDQIERRERDINQFNACQGLSRLATSMTEEFLTNPEKRNGVIPVIDSVLAAGGKGVADYRGSAAAIFSHIYECACKNCGEPKDVTPYLHILLKLAETDWLVEDHAAKLNKVTAMLQHWGPLVQHREEWLRLAGDDKSRLLEVNAVRVVQGIRSTILSIQAAGFAREVISLNVDLQASIDEMNVAAQACTDMMTASLQQKTNVLKPLSKGTDSYDQSWDTGLNEGVGIEKVLQRVEETILTIDGSAYQTMINEVNEAMAQAKSWAQTFDVTADSEAISEANDVLKMALATKYTALLVHAYRTSNGQPPKLRRVVNTYKKEMIEANIMSYVRSDVVEWAAKLSSLKG
ncbi:unnamed protein product [Prorocentrum cordatum]|uniref:Uncharacterized protein n=1 Tax=Prorocentrum cordatum TaxID=2364126 RepID=A0ABN9X911_9DINO|nr:unnamed protein product [Polarella glacialis]